MTLVQHADALWRRIRVVAEPRSLGPGRVSGKSSASRTGLKGLLVGAGLIWTFAAPQTQAAPPATAKTADCYDTAMTADAMDGCAEKEGRQADKHLNAAYQDVLRYMSVGDPERAELIAAQRAWIVFRDADCKFFGAGNGELAPVNRDACLASLSEARAKELDQWPPNAPRDALVPVSPAPGK